MENKKQKCYITISILDNENNLKEQLKKLNYKRITSKQFGKNIYIYFWIDISNEKKYNLEQQKIKNICNSLHINKC